MATVTRTIISGGGGNYTTIAAWEAATNLNSGADIWKGVISDNAAYDESVTINGGGTNNTSSYVWLTVASGNRHAGVWDAGKARIAYTGANTAAIQLESDYVELEWLQIHRPASGSIGTSDEGIRVTSTADTGCLISRCLIWTDDASTTNDTDGIYIGNWPITSLCVDHCVIYGWARSGLHMQNFSGNNALTVQADHCAIGFDGSGASDEGSLSIRNDGTSNIAFTGYNSWFHGDVDGGTRSDYDVNLYIANSGPIILAGSNNAFTTLDTGYGDLTQNWTSNQTPTSDSPVDTDTSGELIVADATAAPTTATDLTAQNLANNVLIGNGTDRQGSEPDPRQDFSTDITGASRPTTGVDIGPFQVSGGATAPTGTPTVVAAVSATGQADAQADPTGTATVVVAVSATGQADAQADPTGTPTVVTAVSATGQASATVGTTGTPTVVTAVSATGQADAQADPTGTPTVVTTVSAAGQASGQADPTGTPSVTLTVAGTGQADGQADPTGTATIVTTVSGTGVAAATTLVTGTPTVVTVVAAAGQVDAQADPTGTPTVVVVVAGTGQASTVTADPNPITVTLRDTGHTTTLRDTGHMATLRDWGHTATLREHA